MSTKSLVKRLRLKNGPNARTNYGLCNNGQMVYIYGGWNGKTRMDDLWELRS